MTTASMSPPERFSRPLPRRPLRNQKSYKGSSDVKTIAGKTSDVTVTAKVAAWSPTSLLTTPWPRLSTRATPARSDWLRTMPPAGSSHAAKKGKDGFFIVSGFEAFSFLDILGHTQEERRGLLQSGETKAVDEGEIQAESEIH